MTITSDDILGKLAIDPDGEVLGVVMMLHIDKGEKRILGMTVDQGFMKPDLYIGANHIKNFGVDSIFLGSVPGEKYKGMEVLTNEGELLGKVVKVITDNDVLRSLILKKHFFSRMKYQVNVKCIDRIGASVILKKGYDEPEVYVK